VCSSNYVRHIFCHSCSPLLLEKWPATTSDCPTIATCAFWNGKFRWNRNEDLRDDAGLEYPEQNGEIKMEQEWNGETHMEQHEIWQYVVAICIE